MDEVVPGPLGKGIPGPGRRKAGPARPAGTGHGMGVPWPLSRIPSIVRAWY